MPFTMDSLYGRIESATEPGAMVRLLNQLSSACGTKEELKRCAKAIIQNDDGAMLDGSFPGLLEQCLIRVPFFMDEIHFEKDVAKPELLDTDYLLITQAELVQGWYDEAMPMHRPEKKEMPEGLQLRVATEADVPGLRILVNQAYAELGAMGLQFMGVAQDEEQTRNRMQGKEVWLLEEALSGKMIATVSLDIRREGDVEVLFLGQFGVSPESKKSGLGSILLHHAFQRAQEQGIRIIRLDTAVPAFHLVRLYRRFGFEIVGVTRWDVVNYPSFIMAASVDEYLRGKDA